MENQSAARDKWRMLLLIALAELLAMSVWLSASAVVPALTDLWDLTASGQSWLTMSVQIGFVVGAFGSAVYNLADRFSSKLVFVISAALAAIVTALIPILSPSFTIAILLRFLTGMFLAGVYPVGMKLMATWTIEDRGLGIGLLVGALTVGTASPHLLKALGGVGDSWQPVMYLAAGLASLSAIIGSLFIQEGPNVSTPRSFSWKYVRDILSDRPVALANLGYLGHMWELYGMWTWMPFFLLASFEVSGVENREVWASVAAFGVIAVGGIGSVIAGKFADKIGRTTVTMASLLVSGICAVLIGFLYGSSPIFLVLVALIWGFAIVADSAQFSACVSELAQQEYVGTALALQTSLGFLLTLVSIRLIPTLRDSIGWEWAFGMLALGPMVGFWAMRVLRASDAALKLASGNR